MKQKTKKQKRGTQMVSARVATERRSPRFSPVRLLSPRKSSSSTFRLPIVAGMEPAKGMNQMKNIDEVEWPKNAREKRNNPSGRSWYNRSYSASLGSTFFRVWSVDNIISEHLTVESILLNRARKNKRHAQGDGQRFAAATVIISLVRHPSLL